MSGPMLRITVTEAGDITADGQPTTLEDLTDRLARLAREWGTVWYHRENPEGEAHPNALKVVRLVVQNELPIALSPWSDAPDAVGGPD